MPIKGKSQNAKQQGKNQKSFEANAGVMSKKEMLIFTSSLHFLLLHFDFCLFIAQIYNMSARICDN